MYPFTNILFSPLGETDDAEAARRVGGLAERSDAQVTLFGVIPEPSRFQRAVHRSELYDAIQEAERTTLADKLARWASMTGAVEAETKIDVGDPARSIIGQVLIGGHDLVVVSIDDDEEGRTTIKRLMRKCPCPVCVISPNQARTQRVLAAVNPDPDEADLNHTIVGLASMMVDLYGGELHVVHAWELYGETTMRSLASNQVGSEEIAELLRAERTSRHDALDGVLADLGVDCEPGRIHLHQGPAGRIICEAVDKNRIDLLVIGTVARSGIGGLIVGNTAEKVLDNVRCSILVVKPASESPPQPTP